MLIAQLSDLHVLPAGRLYQGRIDANARLAAAVDHLHGMARRPDLVLLTGDLVDDGSPAGYGVLRELLAPLAMPWLAIPGNHDDRAHFRTAFADHAHLPAQGPLHYAVGGHPVRVIGLDSTVAGEDHGLIDAAGLHWLAGTLAEDRHTPTLLMLHHPPFASGIAGMDACRLLDADALADVVRQAPNVERVVCGHVHRAMWRRWAGTVACAAPSTATEIALSLDAQAPGGFHAEPSACLLHLWDDAHGLVTHVSRIGDRRETHAFV